jgi:hypothetical protein
VDSPAPDRPPQRHIISLKGNSYRLKNRDLGRIPAARHDGDNS